MAFGVDLHALFSVFQMYVFVPFKSSAFLGIQEFAKIQNTFSVFVFLQIVHIHTTPVVWICLNSPIPKNMKVMFSHEIGLETIQIKQAIYFKLSMIILFHKQMFLGTG